MCLKLKAHFGPVDLFLILISYTSTGLLYLFNSTLTFITFPESREHFYLKSYDVLTAFGGGMHPFHKISLIENTQ